MDMSVDMCIDMCVDMCIDMSVDMCVDMSVDMCMDMCVDMCIDMCFEMCVDMCVDMCMDMCVDMCVNMHVYGNVCGHVYAPCAECAVCVPERARAWRTCMRARVRLGFLAFVCRHRGLYIGSISASPTACPVRGYGRAGTQSDRLGEAVILSTCTPTPRRSL